MKLIEIMKNGLLYETSIIAIKPSSSFRKRFGKEYGTYYARIPKTLHSIFINKSFKITAITLSYIEYTEDINGEYKPIQKGYNKSSLYIRLPIKTTTKRAAIQIINKNPLKFRVYLI